MSRFNPFTTAAPPTGDPEYINAADTAKHLRAALKRAFAGQKFGVRTSTYSGGSSITVSWTDGPTCAEVEAITSDYEGAGFDGQTDSKFHHVHWLLPDGSTQIYRQGAAQGRSEIIVADPPAPGARKVRFGAHHIFTSREYSPSFRALIIQAIDERHGQPYSDERLYEIKGSPVRGTDLLHQLSHQISALGAQGSRPAAANPQPETQNTKPGDTAPATTAARTSSIVNRKSVCPLSTFKFLLEQEAITADPACTLEHFTTWLADKPGDWRTHLPTFLTELKRSADCQSAVSPAASRQAPEPTVSVVATATPVTPNATTASPCHPITPSPSRLPLPVAFTAPPANEIIIRRHSPTLRLLQSRLTRPA